MRTPPRPHILLIEDSEDDAFFFRWSLQKCGLPSDLTHIADGGAAIEYLRSVQGGAQPRPDLVFLDLKLPTFTGFEILKWLGENAALSPLRVIVLSGSEHSGDISRAQGLGATGYLVKPVSTEQLRAALESIDVPPRVVTPAPS